MILVVVAHPDDECLWCGGFLLRLRDAGHRPLIVCVTNAGNSIRRQEFLSACETLGADGVMLDHADGTDLPVPDLSDELDAIVGRHAGAGRVDCVLTHAPHGNERGHGQHTGCYHRVRAWARKRGVPFGIFSEKPLPYLRPADPTGQSAPVAVVAVKRPFASRWRAMLGPLRWALRGRPGAALWHWRRWQDTTFLDARALVKVAVDVDRKRKLCQRHASQFAGLSEYAALAAPFEYLFFDSPMAARAVAAAIR